MREMRKNVDNRSNDTIGDSSHQGSDSTDNNPALPETTARASPPAAGAAVPVAEMFRGRERYLRYRVERFGDT